MAMNHSAFVLDYEGFATELRPILIQALETGRPAALVGWIEANRNVLVDPYEGTRLPEKWEALLPEPSVQVLGDFALTKFYDPTQSVGLDEAWQDHEELLEKLGMNESLILGTPLGPTNDNLFDPGGCGSYFQTPDEVRTNWLRLESLTTESPSLRTRLDPVVNMLRAAMQLGRGLYVTF